MTELLEKDTNRKAMVCVVGAGYVGKSETIEGFFTAPRQSVDEKLFAAASMRQLKVSG